MKTLMLAMILIFAATATATHVAHATNPCTSEPIVAPDSNHGIVQPCDPAYELLPLVQDAVTGEYTRDTAGFQSYVDMTTCSTAPDTGVVTCSTWYHYYTGLMGARCSTTALLWKRVITCIGTPNSTPIVCSNGLISFDCV